MVRNLYGLNLKKAIIDSKITLSDLSQRSGVARDHLYHLIDGSKEAGIDTIGKIAVALGYDIKLFFNEISVDDVILSEFASLPENYWDFKDSKTDDLIHTLHPYPAVMIYPISRKIIEIVTKHKAINTLLDPFSGSGTVLVEGQLANVPNIIGNDLNPLATLISNSKTACLNEDSFDAINRYRDRVKQIFQFSNHLMLSFSNHITSKYDICNINDDWSKKAASLTNEYFRDSVLSSYKVKLNYPNLGLWFRPEALISLQILVDELDNIKDNIAKTFLMVTLSEVIRLDSNTRNSEFKLFREPNKKIYDKYCDLMGDFNRVLDKNLLKEKRYLNHLKSTSNITILQSDTRFLDQIDDNSVDLIITSPPYGDSHTTVAYGQFSKLSNSLLGLSNDNIDNILLGGKKIHSDSTDFFGSKSLASVYASVKNEDTKRANELLDFFIDLDMCLSSITKKMKINAYAFWVVGNRTVKKQSIPLDNIVSEMSKKYGIKLLSKYYRNISNKVMPSANSPTNISGDTISTMNKEIILFFKKTN